MHSGPENLKQSQTKNSWNPINQFHEIFFWPNSIFYNFKNGQKSFFKLGENCQKCNFTKKKFNLFDFASYFAWTFFKFSGPLAVYWVADISLTETIWSSQYI